LSDAGCRSLRRLPPRLVVGTPRWADRSTAAEVPPPDRAGSGRSATWCCAAADAGESSDGSFRCLTEKIWYPAHRPHESGTPARCARSTCRPSDPLHPQSFDGGARAHIVRKDNREQFVGVCMGEVAESPGHRPRHRPRIAASPNVPVATAGLAAPRPAFRSLTRKGRVVASAFQAPPGSDKRAGDHRVSYWQR
jgi:hypothetical protein